MNQTWGNAKKPSFGSNFGSFGPNLGCRIFFSKIWFRQSLDIMLSYPHVQYQKKLMIQFWESLVKDRRTDGQRDGNDFIGRCPTNVERPILRIFTGKKHPKIKLQRLREIRIWTSGPMVHQINFFSNWNKIFKKLK